jgi:osmoprotectant transport system permease protein
MNDPLSALFQVWAGGEFWEEVLTFLSLVLGSLGIALLIGVPAGIVLTRMKRTSGPVIALLALLQTFPSLALLGLLIPVLGIGERAAIFLAVVYSLFPVVMNTHVGLTQVSPAVRDAARGMGMTGRQVLWRVDLPLALPVILAGVRTGAVYAIGIVTICAVAGVRGLGSYIFRGMARSDDFLIWVGAIPLLLLTLLVFWGLGGIARVARKRSQLGLILGGALIVLLSLHGAWVIARQLIFRSAEVRVGGKNFVEGDILAQILKEMLEAHTNLRVEIVPNLTPNVIYNALKTGEVDVYAEYTGNLWTSKAALGQQEMPRDKSSFTALVREGIRSRHDLVFLKTFGLNNTYALCTTDEVAKKYHLRKISDLRQAPPLQVVVDLDFLDRPDGWAGLVKTYDLALPKPRQVSPDLRYRVLNDGEADLVCGFATDWEIASYHLVVLEDDRGYFPSYHAAPLVRGETLRQHPEIKTVLDRLQGQIDDDTMRRLNAQVAQERRSEADVAREFLRGKGLLP